jgi:PrtD family type I secretion system ABC transporter
LTTDPNQQNPITDLYLNYKSFFHHAFLISLFINILAFAIPVHMLQVYDRVLSSSHLETLIVLTSAVVFALVIQGLLDAIRTRLLQSLAASFENEVKARVFKFSILSASSRDDAKSANAWGMTQSVKNFISGPWMGAFMDLPWVPLYIIVIFQFHFVLGVSAIAALCIMLMLALLNNKLTVSSTSQLIQDNQRIRNHLDVSIRNADAIKGLGMMGSSVQLFNEQINLANRNHAKAFAISSVLTGSSKFFRYFLQVWTLSLSAYLVLNQEMSPGGIVANSIILTKALGCIELLTSGLKNIQEAVQGLIKLNVIQQAKELDDAPNASLTHQPSGELTVENLFYYAKGVPNPTLRNVNFLLQSGDVLAVIGQSGSRKSTLIKLLIGSFKASTGTVRYDGSDVRHLGDDYFMQHVGYLPQQVNLFPGSIVQNIARFTDVDKGQLLLATQQADCHTFISHMAQGYETDVMHLSMGQQQRIALARALYGNPNFLFLDEPNSNLDSEGEKALKEAIATAAKLGKTTVLVAHRASMLQMCSKVLVLNNSNQIAFGPRDEVLQKLSQGAGKAA